MILTLSPNESLTAVMSGAAATTSPTHLTKWREGLGTNTPAGSLSGATAVTLVAAPGAGQREVDVVQIYNGDTAAATVTLAKVTSGTSVTLFAYSIPVGHTLRWSDQGIVVLATTAPAGAGAVSAATVTASEEGIGSLHKTVLTLSGVVVTVGNTTGVSFGGTKVYDFPAGRILILGSTIANISFGLTHAGNVTPINGTMGGDVSMGTTVAGDGTLTAADVDLIPSTSIDPISGGVAGAALAVAAQFDGTTTPVDAFFNIIIDDADVANAASDVLLVTATLTITWVQLGDY